MRWGELEFLIELGISIDFKPALDMVCKHLDSLGSERKTRLRLLNGIMNDVS
jgi:hypothetical protein